MPRTAEQNEALRIATRDAIEGAAVRLFARHGFAASNMRQIAEEAGLSAGSIYRHYESKDELFDELLRQAISGLDAAAAALASDGDPVAMIRGFAEVFLADVAKGDGAAEFYMVINQGFSTDTPAGTAERLAQAQRSLWDAFASVVRRGQASGRFASGDPRQMTAYFFAMLSGVTTMRLAMRDVLTTPGADVVLRILTGGTQG